MATCAAMHSRGRTGRSRFPLALDEGECAGEPDFDAEEERGIRSDSSWVPAGGFADEESALLACLSSQISPFSQRGSVRFRIKGVAVFAHDVVIQRTAEVEPMGTFEEMAALVMPEGSGWRKVRGERKPVTELTYRSLLAMTHKLRNCAITFRSLLTLTYPATFTKDGRQVKRDLDRFIKCVRRRFPGASYAWFLEFQDRGAPHFHMLLTVGEGEIDRPWLGRVWSRIVQGGESCRRVHAHVKQWELIRKPDGAVRYVAKYASKQKQKIVPPDYQGVGRFWGTSPDVKAEPVEVVEMDGPEILKRMGSQTAVRFVNGWGQRMDFRRYLWDQAQKFRTHEGQSP